MIGSGYPRRTGMPPTLAARYAPGRPWRCRRTPYVRRGSVQARASLPQLEPNAPGPFYRDGREGGSWQAGQTSTGVAHKSA
jgi:hypothetical protein